VHFAPTHSGTYTVQESGGDHAVVRGPNTVPDIANLTGKDWQSSTLTDDKVEEVNSKSQKDPR
jgi:hypothetical protein